jgi:hypothetical protein
MNAESTLLKIVRAMAAAKFEGILIGNAGAALQGAPVTTMDFDFFVRDTKLNDRKMAKVSKALHAIIGKPHEGLSDRIIGKDIQVDLMVTAHGIRSFESLRSRAMVILVGGLPLQVASLQDILRSKKTAGRAKDLAVLPVLEATQREKERKEKEKEEA